ncbi:MAG: HEAT repeat domain-containing protein [Trichloromonadaceae bacterium]
MAEPSERIGELVLVRTPGLADTGGDLVRRGLSDLVRLEADPRVSRLVDVMAGEGAWAERVEAWEELHRIGLGSTLAGWGDLLCEATRGEDGWGRIFAAELLSWHRLCPERAVPILVVALEASIEVKRYHWSRVCCGSLGRYPALPRAPREQALDALMAALKVPDTDVRLYAATALASWGKAARRALVGLAACCGSADPDTRQRYRQALISIDPDAVDEFAALSTALDSADPQLRAEATQVLQGMGGLARPALPALLSACRDTHSPVRFHAALALAALGPPEESLPHLENLIADAEPEVRLAAAYALVRGGRRLGRQLDMLLEALANHDPRIRMQAAGYLGETMRRGPPGGSDSP